MVCLALRGMLRALWAFHFHVQSGRAGPLEDQGSCLGALSQAQTLARGLIGWELWKGGGEGNAIIKCAPTFRFKPHEPGPRFLVIKDRLFKSQHLCKLCNPEHPIPLESGNSVTHLGGWRSQEMVGENVRGGHLLWPCCQLQVSL